MYLLLSAVSHHGRDFEFKALVVQKWDGKIQWINDHLFEELKNNAKTVVLPIAKGHPPFEQMRFEQLRPGD